METKKTTKKLPGKLIIIGFVLTLIFSCKPWSKEAYFEDFKSFMEEVRKNHDHYTEEDWREADEKYDKFSGEWYDDWEDEMTLKEKMIVSGYDGEYYLYKGLDKGKEMMQKVFSEENIQEIKRQLKEFKEQNLDEGIKEIQKQAEEIGEEAVKQINEIFKELNIDPKKYQ